MENVRILTAGDYDLSYEQMLERREVIECQKDTDCLDILEDED